MASQSEEQRDVAPTIAELLAELRRRIRLYVWIEGVASVVAFLGLAFWITLGLDWTLAQQGGLGLPRTGRAAALGVVGLLLAYLVFRKILRRAFVVFSDRSLAVVLERRFKEFHDSLLTTVELKERSSPTFSREMLEKTFSDAASQAGHVQVTDVFNPAPLWRAACCAGLLLLSVVGFAIAAPEAFDIYKDRFRLIDRPWPRLVRLVVPGFEKDVVKVARGADLDLLVQAYLNRDQYPLDKYPDATFPRVVAIRYNTEEGGAGRINMIVDRAAEGAEFQEYRHTFQGILSSIRFDLRGDDAVRRDLRIEVVESPKLADTFLYCEYPAYMHRSPALLPMTLSMVLPLGTQVTLRAKSNKPLIRTHVDTVLGDGKTESQVIVAHPAEPDRFDLPIKIDASKTLLFTLYDTDGIHNREPVKLVLTAADDEAPKLAVRPKGISSAITPRARIPIVGQITDDYGLDETWFDYAIDQQSAVKKPFAQPSRGSTDLKVTEALDLRELTAGVSSPPAKSAPAKTAPPARGATSASASSLAQNVAAPEQPAPPPANVPAPVSAIAALKPGQKFSFMIKASDAYSLGKGPNQGASERFVLDVVTDDQLRAMLELRELHLRQRFETIISEMAENRDSLGRLTPRPAEEKPAEVKPAGEKPAGGEKPESKGDCQAAEEPDAAKQKAAVPDEARAKEVEDPLSVRTLRVERSIQNSRKNANETLGVATSFEEMVEELVNNRIDSLELKSRLQNEIADRLKLIGTQMFPEFDKRLAHLQGKLGDEPAAQAALLPALQQADAILSEMEAVLEKMKQMEDFNELLVQLRKIIEDEDDLIEATIKLNKSRVLRDALKD